MSSETMARPVPSNEYNDGVKYLMLRTAMRMYDKIPKELSADEINGIKIHVIKELELQNLILSSEEARDVIVPESLLRSTVSEIKQRYNDEDEFIQDLEDNEISEHGFQSAVMRELKVETTLERVGSRSISISDMDVMIYYHMHKDRFLQPETRVARHILITVNPDYPENTREVVLERINTIYSRLMKKNKRFSEQAMKHSECPTAMNGGRLGNIPRGQLYPQLDEVLFSLKEGQVSMPVESEIGMHLIYCEQIHSPGTVSLKQARPKIINHLQDRARRMCQKAWIMQLKEKKSQSSIKGE